MNRRDLLLTSFATWVGLPQLGCATSPSEPFVLPPDDPKVAPPRAGTAALPDGVLGASALKSSVAGLPDDGVLATVDGESIHAKDVVGLLYLEKPEPIFGALENAIRRRLVAFESARLGVFIVPKRLDDAVDGFIKKQMAAFHMKEGPEVDFATYMERTYGTSTAAYRSILKDVALENMLLERVVRYTARASERVQIRLLALDSFDKAKAIHAKLKEGANFGALAKSESDEEKVKKSGGLLPPVPVTSGHAAVVAVANLEPGAFTEVKSETKFGKTIYWIAKLEKRFPADPRPYADVASELESELEAEMLDNVELLLWDQEVRNRYAIAVRLGRA